MKIKEIEALTGSAQKTIYRWMLRHPKLDVESEESLLGHPFPRPTAKDGREVVWDESAVNAWWADNAGTIGRHSQEKSIVVMPWKSYRKAMSSIPPPTSEDEEQGRQDELEHIQRFERVGDNVRLWFANVDDAIHFKMRWS